MDQKPFLTAEWRRLVMLNYEVDASLLTKRVPRGVDLDSWQGRTYVSLIGFLFLNTRVRGFLIPFHRNFEEVNLRFYVRRGDRRGVVFIREIVPRRAVAWVANTVYGENYVRLAMRHRVDAKGFEYSWRSRGQWNRIIAEKFGTVRPIAPGSHEEFIAEHFWGYAPRSADATDEYRVEHPAWLVQAPDAARFEGSVVGVYPREFGFIDERPPNTAFVADGSTVAVFPAQRVQPATDTWN
ncbi:MAG: YqjF family protein [Candidatus Acidiferrales bacterium]